MEQQLYQSNVLYLALYVVELKKILAIQNKELKYMKQFNKYSTLNIRDIKNECKKYNIKPLLKLKDELINEIIEYKILFKIE